MIKQDRKVFLLLIGTTMGYCFCLDIPQTFQEQL
jgi:MFS family permease